ncbi:MAG TPA: hypothetical protein VJ617_18175 [Arthrobacter sp.]|nr:hypothetical protein [Arthrobacter sp.]
MPGALQGSRPSPAGVQRSAGAVEERPPRRSVAAVDEKALRAASLRSVSRDLERLLRERTR